MKIMVPNVRLAFHALWRPANFNGESTGKYSATFLIDKTSQAEVVAKIQAAIAEAVKNDLKGAKLPPDKLCLRDGDESEYDGFDGHWSLKASNSTRPLVLNRDRSPVTEADGVVYAGCYVNALVNTWSQDNQWGRRINANLLGIQFVRDGEPFGDGGRIAKQDEFSVIEEGNADELFGG